MDNDRRHLRYDDTLAPSARTMRHQPSPLLLARAGLPQDRPAYPPTHKAPRVDPGLEAWQDEAPTRRVG